MYKIIEGYIDYTVSTDGIIVSYKLDKLNGKVLKQIVHRNGYYFVALCSIGYKPKVSSVHRLVATAFIPNPGNLPQVNHKDGNKANNSVSNLEWVSGLDNINHCVSIGMSCRGTIPSHNSSGFVGVSFDKKNNKYAAYITVLNKKINLGYYSNVEEAAMAYNEASLIYHNTDGVHNGKLNKLSKP